MSRQQQVEKREKSLIETLMVILLVVVLMASFIYYYFKHQAGVSSVGFNALSHSFSAKLTSVHAQWLMEGKPASLVLRTSLAGEGVQTRQQQRIVLNAYGWVDAPPEGQKNVSRCDLIWQQVMDVPMMFLRSPVSSLELRRPVLPQTKDKQRKPAKPSSREKYRQHPGSICRYSLLSGEYFQYHLFNGTVETSAG
ncbi:hypothetical protein [Thalassomonas actiniarum]|uniref:Uncharacterized protein n=1 Tax=Thalassomonas actiniarum TaxID=485447 RepID=A0AAF0C2T5_9GAMM|nr:hypothetical protein [Thalassomonas actiniarum]WDD98185.1 hypothetical protein SG35_023360 [Thalassomonas actiniarum]